MKTTRWFRRLALGLCAAARAAELPLENVDASRASFVRLVRDD